MELRPFDPSDYELLSALQQQDDVWEFIGSLPLPPEEGRQHLFTIVENQVRVGVAGIIRSQALEGNDFELLCAVKSDAQSRGLAKQACKLVLEWAFDTAKLDRVMACIDDTNEAARSIAAKLGMTEFGARSRGSTLYVKYRDEEQSNRRSKLARSRRQEESGS